jgi:hypothetical protein
VQQFELLTVNTLGVILVSTSLKPDIQDVFLESQDVGCCSQLLYYGYPKFLLTQAIPCYPLSSLHIKTSAHNSSVVWGDFLNHQFPVPRIFFIICLKEAGEITCNILKKKMREICCKVICSSIHLNVFCRSL